MISLLWRSRPPNFITKVNHLPRKKGKSVNSLKEGPPSQSRPVIYLYTYIHIYKCVMLMFALRAHVKNLYMKRIGFQHVLHQAHILMQDVILSFHSILLTFSLYVALRPFTQSWLCWRCEYGVLCYCFSKDCTKFHISSSVVLIA